MQKVYLLYGTQGSYRGVFGCFASFELADTEAESRNKRDLEGWRYTVESIGVKHTPYHNHMAPNEVKPVGECPACDWDGNNNPNKVTL